VTFDGAIVPGEARTHPTDAQAAACDAVVASERGLDLQVAPRLTPPLDDTPRRLWQGTAQLAALKALVDCMRGDR
jgi:hypothetical protein